MMRHPDPQWILSSDYDMTLPGSDKRCVSIKVGAPFETTAEWACAVSLEGLEGSYVVYGNDGLQALALALKFLRRRLHDLVDKGARIHEAGANDDSDTLTLQNLDVIFGRVPD